MSLLFPLTFYIKEIYWRTFYILIGIFALILISLNFIEYFFLFEVYPFFKFLHSRFIVTHITQILSSTANLSIYIICIFIFPFLSYHIIAFLSNGLYTYQSKILHYYIRIVSIVWLSSFLLVYDTILFILFNFLTQWELVNESISIYSDIKLQLQTYIYWTLMIYSTISFFFNTILFVFFFFISFLNSTQLFTLFHHFRKHIIFIFNILSFFLLSLDIFTQLSIFIFSLLWIETSFLFSCFLVKV